MARTVQALGISSTFKSPFTSLMVVEDMKRVQGSELDQTIDESGNVVADNDDFYKKTWTISGTGTLLSAGSIPDVADTVSFDSVTYKYREVSEIQNAEKKPKFEFTAVYDVPTT